MVMKSLTGKTALITGGSRGIGRATALKLAEQGADVVIVYFNSSDEAQAVCKAIQDMGQKAMAFAANVADEASIKSLFDEIAEPFPTIDILISNAASGVLKPALAGMRLKHWNYCLNTNAFALHNLVSNCYTRMPRGGRVIALSSLGSVRAIPNYAFIGASKAALESLARSLALELAPFGITCNIVSAGVVSDTDAITYFPNKDHLLDEFKAKALTDAPLTAARVADAIYLLCLNEARDINGHTLVVDDGYSIVG